MSILIMPPIDSAQDMYALASAWALALDRALHAGVEIFTTPNGERFATSTSQLDRLYRVTPETCECAAAHAGAAVCPHRAALRAIFGTLPVVVVHVEDLEPDADAWMRDAHTAQAAFTR